MTRAVNLASAGSIVSESVGTAPGYMARAWVNFNGTVPAANMIRAAGNVSSITDNGVGDYTVNFTTAMADANYSAVGSVGGNLGGVTANIPRSAGEQATGSVRVTASTTSTFFDAQNYNVAIFR